MNFKNKIIKKKNITSLSELKESIVTLRDKNYKTTRAIKDTEKGIILNKIGL